jgi:multiple sugar transport system substrate-binding protein
MKAKKVLALGLTAAMAISLAACGDAATTGEAPAAASSAAAATASAAASSEAPAAASSSAASGEKQKISFCFRDDGQGENSPLYKWIKAGYDNWDKKDQVEIDFAQITASEGDYFTKIALELADPGTCPDLVCEDTFQLPNDAAAGYLTNLNDYVSDYEDWNNGKYYDSMKNIVTVDGSVYGIPYCTDTRGLWYNRKILTDAGVIAEGADWAPKTWADVLAACKAIKEKCPDVVPFWCNSGTATGEATSMQTYEMLLYGTGERLLDSNGKWIVKSKGIEDSLGFINDIYTNGYGPDLDLVLNGQASNTSARDYFPNDKLGISLDGIWITGNWKDTGASPVADYATKFGLAAMPTSEGQDPGSISLTGGWALSIPQNSDAKDITFEFVKHLMDPDACYLDTILAQGNICTRTDVADLDEYKAQPFFQEATQFLDFSDFRPQNDKYSSVSTCIQTMVESVVTGTSISDAEAQYASDVAAVVGNDSVVEQ